MSKQKIYARANVRLSSSETIFIINEEGSGSDGDSTPPIRQHGWLAAAHQMVAPPTAPATPTTPTTPRIASMPEPAENKAEVHINAEDARGEPENGNASAPATPTTVTTSPATPVEQQMGMDPSMCPTPVTPPGAENKAEVETNAEDANAPATTTTPAEHQMGMEQPQHSPLVTPRREFSRLLTPLEEALHARGELSATDAQQMGMLAQPPTPAMLSAECDIFCLNAKMRQRQSKARQIHQRQSLRSQMARRPARQLQRRSQIHQR